MTIGRHPTSTLCLTDNLTISNRHVTLEQRYSESTGKRTVILHETSSNGTTINGIQYQKGQSVELANETEIIFPQEDDKLDRKQDFIFIFHVLEEESDAISKTPQNTGALSGRAEWMTLQDQCDDLAREIARLAASVYANNDKTRALADTLRPGQKSEDANAMEEDPLCKLALGMFEALKMAENRLNALGEVEGARQLGVHKWQAELERFGMLESPPPVVEPSKPSALSSASS